jgi:hypothetical protein
VSFRKIDHEQEHEHDYEFGLEMNGLALQHAAAADCSDELPVKHRDGVRPFDIPAAPAQT